MKSIALCVLLAACSSSSSPSMTACSATLSGDATGTESCSHLSLCHPTGGDLYEAISTITASTHAIFEVDGVFELRSYALADLRAADLEVDANGKHYEVGVSLGGGSTAALTVTGLVKPTMDPCDGTAHGSATATLVEVDPSTGMPAGSGRVDLALTF